MIFLKNAQDLAQKVRLDLRLNMRGFLLVFLVVGALLIGTDAMASDLSKVGDAVTKSTTSIADFTKTYVVRAMMCLGLLAAAFLWFRGNVQGCKTAALSTVSSSMAVYFCVVIGEFFVGILGG